MKHTVGLVVLVATVACTGDAVGPRDGPLHLSVDVARPAIAVGDTTTVTIRLRNLSPVTVTFVAGGCPMLPYIAERTSREVVYPSGGGWVCVLILQRVTLGPWGEETRQVPVRGVAEWPATFDAALPPGEYLVYATLESPEYQLRSASAAIAVK